MANLLTCAEMGKVRRALAMLIAYETATPASSAGADRESTEKPYRGNRVKRRAAVGRDAARGIRGMRENSAIEWTTHTFNPWWGCARISPACVHCYADSQAQRYGHQVWRRNGPGGMAPWGDSWPS